MKRNWKNGLGSAIVALSLVGAGGALASDEYGIDTWDADGDAVVNFEEFGAGFDKKGAFEAWDANDDGVIDKDEYARGVYDSYDRDGDGDLNEDEFGYYADDAGEDGFWDI